MGVNSVSGGLAFAAVVIGDACVPVELTFMAATGAGEVNGRGRT